MVVFVTIQECDGTIYQTTEKHTHVVYGVAPISDEYLQSSFIDNCTEPPTSDFRSERPTASKFPAFVGQDIQQPQDRPWFHEYKRRRTNEVTGTRSDALCVEKGKGSRLLAPPVSIDLTSQSSGLRGRFQSGLSLMRGFIPADQSPHGRDGVRQVYHDIQNSRS